MKIEDLQLKPTGVINASQSLREAAKQMDENALSELAVEQDGRVIGLLDDHEVMRSVVAHGLDADAVKAGEVPVVEGNVLFKAMDVKDALKLLQSKHVDRAVVVDAEGAVAGLVRCAQLENACREADRPHEGGGRFFGFSTTE